MILRLKLLVAAMAAALFLQGCVAAIPLVVAIMNDGATVVAEVPASADTVYKKALEMADANEKITIAEKDESKHYVRVTRDDDEASLKAVVLSPSRSQMIITADIAGEDGEGNKKLALTIAKNICDNLGVDYEVVENP